jgi:hypothetical protein
MQNSSLTFEWIRGVQHVGCMWPATLHYVSCGYICKFCVLQKITQQFGWFDVPLTVVFHMCPTNQTTIFVVTIYQKRLNILRLDCDY